MVEAIFLRETCYASIEKKVLRAQGVFNISQGCSRSSVEDCLKIVSGVFYIVSASDLDHAGMGGEETIAHRCVEVSDPSLPTLRLFSSWFCPYAQRSWAHLEELRGLGLVNYQVCHGGVVRV